jgi:hypothetical protein
MRRTIWSIKIELLYNTDELQGAVKHGDAHITVKGEIRRKNSNRILARKKSEVKWNSH